MSLLSISFSRFLTVFAFYFVILWMFSDSVMSQTSALPSSLISASHTLSPNSTYAMSPAPSTLSSNSIETYESLPVLKNPPVAQLPFTTASDSFAIPVRWNIRIVHPQPTISSSNPNSVTDAASLLARLPIRQALPGKEILIDTTPVRLYGTFLIQDGKTAVKFKVEQITTADITFTTGRDFTLYRYLIPGELIERK